MIEFFKKLFCNHRYELVDQVQHMYRICGNWKPCGTEKIYICKKCGKVKRIKY